MHCLHSCYTFNETISIKKQYTEADKHLLYWHLNIHPYTPTLSIYQPSTYIFIHGHWNHYFHNHSFRPPHFFSTRQQPRRRDLHAVVGAQWDPTSEFMYSIYEYKVYVQQLSKSFISQHRKWSQPLQTHRTSTTCCCRF